MPPAQDVLSNQPAGSTETEATAAGGRREPLLPPTAPVVHDDDDDGDNGDTPLTTATGQEGEEEEDGLSQAPTAPAQDAAAHGEEEEEEEPPAGMTVTENGRACLADSGSACMDLYFQAVLGTASPDVATYVSKAWQEDRATTLRLIFQLGNCRKGQGGKMDRVNFTRGLIWLWNKDPKTLLGNLPEIVEHGCYKTLLDLWHEVMVPGCFEEEVQKAAKHKAHRSAIRQGPLKIQRRKDRRARQMALKEAFAAEQNVPLGDIYTQTTVLRHDKKNNGQPWSDVKGKWSSESLREKFTRFIEAREKRLHQEARAYRQWKTVNVAVVTRCFRHCWTPEQKELAKGIVKLFVDALERDHERMLTCAPRVSGLAAKWAPRLRNVHVNPSRVLMATLIADELLARKILSSAAATAGQGVCEPASIRYNRFLARICRAAQIPESFVGRGEWDLVNYRRMPSLCRAVWGDRVWKKHDGVRYQAFVREQAARAREGKKSYIATGALLPHKVACAATEDSVEQDLQWHGMVTRMIQARGSGGDGGLFIPVCDVSGSMIGDPMDVAITLSLLIAESAPRDSALWGKMFTFHEQPSLLTVPDIPDHAAGEVPKGGLAKRVAWVKSMPWGGSTDMDAVFATLLALCLENAIPASVVDAMKVCVFSDMQFDEACKLPVGSQVFTEEDGEEEEEEEATTQQQQQQPDWETVHDAMVRKWRTAGYSSPPTIVYWNLRAGGATAGTGAPADAHREGVVMLSGFSPHLLEAFLAGDYVGFTPHAQMLAALEKEEYARLVCY